MDQRRWEEVAATWDAAQGDDGDLWHRTLIHPAILKVIGPVRGREIADIGCGNGSLARHLARMGNRVVGIDASAPIIEKARVRESATPLGVEYHVSDASRMPMLRGASYDLVTSCMALMDMNDEAVAGALKEMARIVKPSGRIVIIICHPCFDVPGASTWLMEREFGHEAVKSLRLTRYRENFSIWIPISTNFDFELQTYHRPMSWYFSAMRDAGLAVTNFYEAEASPEFMAQENRGHAIDKFPLHCVFEARRFAPR